MASARFIQAIDTNVLPTNICAAGQLEAPHRESSCEQGIDETRILNFRHLLERHGLGKKLSKRISRHLQDNALLLRERSIINATIIAGPTATKSRDGELDPDKPGEEG